MSTVHVKICGLTSVDDALACIDAGAHAIGLNLIPGTPRAIDVPTARAISEAIGARALVVGVVADLGVDELLRLRDAARLGCLQLHGDEPPSAVAALLPHAYKAIRVASERDVDEAARYPGEHILVDARVAGRLGGTGVRVDPALVAPLARVRRLTLAGGLDPSNVAAAITAVRPYAVDVASGVEGKGTPRHKDLAAVRAFVAAAIGASRDRPLFDR